MEEQHQDSKILRRIRTAKFSAIDWLDRALQNGAWRSALSSGTQLGFLKAELFWTAAKLRWRSAGGKSTELPWRPSQLQWRSGISVIFRDGCTKVRPGTRRGAERVPTTTCSGVPATRCSGAAFWISQHTDFSKGLSFKHGAAERVPRIPAD